MNVSEFVVSKIVSHKIEVVFSVTGGGAMHLNDAFGKNKKFKCIYLHHEQSCSMAADAYARVKKKPAVVCATTVPGGINALNGVFGAFTDSIPMIIITGQVKTSTSKVIQKKNLRQLGDQENDIVSMAEKITKKIVLIKNKNYLLKNLNNIIITANKDRPGPVWIDIPADIQGEEI